MSEMTPATNVTAPVPYRSPWQRWKDFWFYPADPTTLGFIRIMTGLLVLYIHLAYSVDLQNFFGPHGWYAGRFIERERHESPSMVQPLNDKWSDPAPVFAQLSDFPHRRAALMEYLRSLPADPAARERDLAYLKRVSGLRNPLHTRAALEYIHRIGSRESDLERYATALTGGTVFQEQEPEPLVFGLTITREPLDVTKSYVGATPEFFRELPTDQKVQLASEVRTFWHSLSHERVKWTNPDRDRSYVLSHFVEVLPESRQALLDFMTDLPADDAQRKARLDYIEYWNTDPTKTYRQGGTIFSLWFHVKDPTEMALVHSGVLVLILLFTLGLFTRVTSVLVWLATVSYIHRTQQVLFGMDTMMNILLFYLMIGNSGAALSLDRLIARYRAVRASLRRSGTIDANTRAFLACPPPSVSAGLALRLIQVHFCFIYAAAGLSKLKGATWWNGQAFWDVVVNPEFTLMRYQFYENFLHRLMSVKIVYYVTTAIAVWSTLFIEIASPFLLWTRLRWLMIFLATAMHAVIGVLMGLNLFELLMIVMLLAFLPDRVIRDRFRGGWDLARLSMTFNPQKAVHARAAALALASDVDNQITLAPNPTATTVMLVDSDMKAVSGPAGVTTFFKEVRLPALLGFVLWIPGLRGLMSRFLFPDDTAMNRDIKTTASLTRSPAARG
jgi:hypothetical protein